MNAKNWNDALNCLDIDIVENFIAYREELAKKSHAHKNLWFRIGAIAACLAIFLSAVIIYPNLREDDPGVTPSTGTPVDTAPDIPIVNVQAPSSAPQYFGIMSDPPTFAGTAADILMDGVSVTAKFVRALPDTYTFYDDWLQKPYRIIEFEVVHYLKGMNMPESFYFLIPERYMTDFSTYEYFVIKDMGMFGYDYSVLYNKTAGCAEQLDVVLFGSSCADANYLSENFKAFNKEGYFEFGLWESTDAWIKSTQWIFDYKNPYNDEYSIEQAEKNAQEDDNERSVALVDAFKGEAEAALDYTRNFKNGLYVTDSNGFKLFRGPNISLTLRRYIDGFATNESVSIHSPDKAFWSNARFAQEDMQKLPDLQSAVVTVISALEAGEIKPPHLKNANQENIKSSGVFGWYAKTANGVIGVLKVSWYYEDSSLEHYDDNRYFDDAYYIIEYGSDKCTAINRDDLLDKMKGFETVYVYTDDYDEYGKIRNIYVPMP